MSSARGRASRRDDNEPEIRKRFAVHGWHTETLSAPGMPDLLAYPPRPSLLGFTQVKHVDVKGAKGKPTPAQVEKWTALSVAGIPVYVCRTRADVDALVAGTLEPWEPEARRPALEDVFMRRLSSGTRRAESFAEMAQRLAHQEESRIRSERSKAAYMRKLAEAEEARIPERAEAEMTRRGKAFTPGECCKRGCNARAVDGFHCSDHRD